ncbi:MAG TPA: ATP-binding protein [Nitrosomonas nitrosa]|uniref:Putative transcriptional regulator n=1 Tax=Nitrosomonas nitrosa TaxID=52442 RepID=A0A8H9DBL9_9PROT|nr:ATP-binding protein [Nitrosomonas nitrosa]CAE6507536.1 putative transcriptional regulator [Nitrosomonas nitrosa]HNP52931.1 ATP-binding protein [Nitrosomonas nitrosa]
MNHSPSNNVVVSAMISQERDIALIDELRGADAETACVEFKQNNADPDRIGVLCSALSNSARIEDKAVAYVLWGIDDSSHNVIGTTFSPDAQKVGNQDFQFWLAQLLKPDIALSFRTLQHPDGKVVMLEIPAATSAPVEFKGTAYCRIGSATPKLSDHPQRFQKLINNLRPYRWEKENAKTYQDADEVLKLLDYPKYFSLTGQNLPDHKAGILERLEADHLIVRDVGGRWNITNLGAILFATDLGKFDSSLARKAVRFIAYGGHNKSATVTHRHDGVKGYASGFEGLVGYINGLLPVNEHIGAALRESRPLFPEIAIRELIANALIHQDMTIQGAGPQIELFQDRIEITNPGDPLVQPDRMIDLPPRSRNEMLASLMRRMRFCEEQGSGLDKVVMSIEVYQLPPLKIQAEGGSTQVILYGPRSFAEMNRSERVRACYQHAVLKWLSGEKMKNSTLCERFGIDKKNAAQASQVISAALEEGKIKVADPDHPRAGYFPFWG